MKDTDATEGISHDKTFKTLFRHFLKDLVELVHPELARLLDLDHHEFIDVSGFADFRKHGHVVPDLVARTTTRSGEDRVVLAHVEPQYEFRSVMDSRMEECFMQLTLEYKCPVVSIAVFLHGGPPGVERREVVRKVGPWISNRFSYLAFGLSGSLAERWLERPQPLAAALAALMRSEVWDKMEQALHCLQAIGRADVEDDRRFILAKIVRTYVELSEAEQERLRAELAKEANKEVREMVITWDETIAESKAAGIAEGEARGRTEGEARGRVEGQRIATREAIGLVLKRRGISGTANVLAKLEAIEDLSKLHELLEQAMDARSIDDLHL